MSNIFPDEVELQKFVLVHVYESHPSPKVITNPKFGTKPQHSSSVLMIWVIIAGI